MNNRRARLLAAALLVISFTFLGAEVTLAQSRGGTITALSASYSPTTGKVHVLGRAEDLTKDIVIIEIHTPSNALLYFGTAEVDKDGSFDSSVTVGAIPTGTYKVRSADYEGGEYKTVTFTVFQENPSLPPSGETEGELEQQSPDAPQVVVSTGKVTVVLKVPGTVDEYGSATFGVSKLQIEDAISLAVEQAQKSTDQLVVLDIKFQMDAALRSCKILLSKGAVELIAQGPADILTLETPLASVSFNKRAISALSASAEDSVAFLTTLVETQSLLGEAMEIVGNRPVYSFSLTSGASTISKLEGVMAVSVPHTAAPDEYADAIVVYSLDSGEEPVPIPNSMYHPESNTATFRVNRCGTYAVGYNNVSFEDVAQKEWYAEAIRFIAARNITNGTGNMNYSPSQSVTRSQFLVMTMRAYGIDPDENPEENFIDAGETYYTGYLAAAKRLGISDGIGNGLFAPDREITRQEMFVLLHRTIQILGESVLEEGEKDLSRFEDASLLAPWAQTAVDTMVRAGIIQGDANHLNPQNTATRAEMAQMLFRLLSN